MKTGYSILLGEFVDAKALEHRDCEPFQVVCAVCNEPLFKVERAAEAASTEYLSHYRQGDSFDAACELRAQSKTQAERNKHNAESRDQKLKYFLSVFTSLLERDPYFSYGKGIETTHKQINRSNAWRFFRNEHLESARASGIGDRTEFRGMADFYIKEGYELQGFPSTGFSTTTQIRISSDLMGLLLSAPGKPNYEALFNHAAIYLLSRFSTPNPLATAEDNEVSNNIARFVMSLITFGKKAGMDALTEMAQTRLYPPYVERPSSYILKVASEISHEMIGTLLRLPYFMALKKEWRKKHVASSLKCTADHPSR